MPPYRCCLMFFFILHLSFISGESKSFSGFKKSISICLCNGNLDYLCTSFVDPHITYWHSWHFFVACIELCVRCVMSCVGDFDILKLKDKSFHVLLLSFGKVYRKTWLRNLMDGRVLINGKHIHEQTFNFNQIIDNYKGSNLTAKCQ